MHRTKTIRSPIVLIILLLASLTRAQTQEHILNHALTTAVILGIPGVSAAIGLGDSILWAGTAGYSDLEKRIPVKTDDRFGVGSITKTFVARVILQLAEEGKVDLNTPASSYITALAECTFILRGPVPARRIDLLPLSFCGRHCAGHTPKDRHASCRVDTVRTGRGVSARFGRPVPVGEQLVSRTGKRVD